VAGETEAVPTEKMRGGIAGPSQAARRVAPSGVFKPLRKRKTTSEVVLGQIIALLTDGKLQPGDRLPTERDLAALLGVGRPSVREALSALSLLGIVEQRQGRGTFLVDRLDRLPVEPYLYQLLLVNQRIFDDLIEVRKLLEPGIAALAAQRATNADREEILRSLTSFELLLERGGDTESEAAAGTDFHQTLARATGNQTLARLIDSLRDLLSATGHVLSEHERGTSLEAHRALAESILERDPKTAERLMRQHLDEVSDRMSAARTQSLAAKPRAATEADSLR
jgi:GntR family transcriptional regulator, transcriptional repressor for pyruvate dehydrogenase complex